MNKKIPNKTTKKRVDSMDLKDLTVDNLKDHDKQTMSSMTLKNEEEDQENLFKNFSCDNLGLQEEERQLKISANDEIPNTNVEERKIEDQKQNLREKENDESTIKVSMNENLENRLNEMEKMVDNDINKFSEIELEEVSNRINNISKVQENLDEMVDSSARILMEINKKVIANVYEEMDSNLFSWQMVMDFLRMEKEGLFMDSKIKMLKESWFLDKDEEFEAYITKSQEMDYNKTKIKCRERFHEKEHICSDCKNEKDKKKITFMNLMLSNTNVRKWSLENNCQISLNLNLLKVKAEEFNLDDHRKKLVIYNKSENSKLVELEMSMKRKKNFREELPSSYFDFSLGCQSSTYSMMLERSVTVSLSSKYLVTAMRSMHQERPIFFDMSCVNAVEVREKDKNCFFKMMRNVMPEIMSENKMDKLFEVSCMSDLPMEMEMLLLTQLKRRNLYISIRKENSLLNHISTEDFSGAHKIKGYLLSTLELRSIKFYRMDLYKNRYDTRNWSMRMSDETLERTLAPIKKNCFFEVVKAIVPEVVNSNRIQIFKEMHCMLDMPGDLMSELSRRAEHLEIYVKMYGVDDYRNHISLMPCDNSDKVPFLRLLDDDLYNVRFYEDKENRDIMNSLNKTMKEKEYMITSYLKDMEENNTKSPTFGFIFYNYFKYNNMDRDSMINIISRLRKFYKHTFISLEDFKVWVKLNNSLEDTDTMMMENNILFLMYDIMQVNEISRNSIEIDDTSLTAEEVIKIKRRRSFDVEETKKLYRLYNYFNKRINPEDKSSDWKDMVTEFIINTEAMNNRIQVYEDESEIYRIKATRSNSNYNTEAGREFEHEEVEEDWVKI